MTNEHDRPAPDRELDRLLERAGLVDVPADLADRTRRHLADARRDLAAEERLDALLDRWPEPEVPADLAARTSAGVRSAANARHSRVSRQVLGLVAAALLALLGGWWLRSRIEPDGVEPAILVADGGRDASRSSDAKGPSSTGPDASGAADEPGRELLEALDALENWELLTTDDVDLLLAGLDLDEEALFELETGLVAPFEEGASDEESPETEPERKKS